MKMNITGSQSRIQKPPMLSSVALVTILAKTFFRELHWVLVPDLHTPDLLPMVYLGLFKHMMDWIQAFLKKHG